MEEGASSSKGFEVEGGGFVAGLAGGVDDVAGTSSSKGFAVA